MYNLTLELIIAYIYDYNVGYKLWQAGVEIGDASFLKSLLCVQEVSSLFYSDPLYKNGQHFLHTVLWLWHGYKHGYFNKLP